MQIILNMYISCAGLTGCSKDNYVTHLVEKARKKDCIAVVMNYRGIEVELKTPRSYSAANLEGIF